MPLREKMPSLVEFSYGSPTRVLLVESDSEARARYANALRLAGYSIFVMAEPDEHSRVGPPLRLVVAPVACYVALRRTYARVPIVVTAETVSEGVNTCLLGADDWVPCGCATEYFLDVVSVTLRGRPIAQ